MKIGLAADHAGFGLKEAVKKMLQGRGCEVKDYGTFSTESVDYPDFAHGLGEAIDKHELGVGIVMCGSGNGINMTVNKHQGVRSALCWNKEIAELARKHNNANVLAMPARFVAIEQGLDMVRTFLNTEFEGGRHQSRVDKISCP